MTTKKLSGADGAGTRVRCFTLSRGNCRVKGQRTSRPGTEEKYLGMKRLGYG